MVLVSVVSPRGSPQRCISLRYKQAHEVMLDDKVYL